MRISEITLREGSEIGIVATPGGRKIKLWQEHWGYSHGQHDMSVIAYDAETNDKLGYLDYSLYQGRVHIKYVESSAQREGIGTLMVQALAKEHGPYNIDWGMTTPSGTALQKRFNQSRPEASPKDFQVLAVTDESQIDPYARVRMPPLYRGVEGGTDAIKALRAFRGGDLGNGIYFTAWKKLAASYGGGPKASVRAGTRVVHTYEITRPLFPEEVAYLFGGAHDGDECRLVSGNGIEFWRGPWESALIEQALADQEISIVIGTPESIGVNQIAVRDPSLVVPVS